MKKILSNLFISIAVLTTTVSGAFAENFYYKIYNPKTKEVSSNIIMTVSSGSDKFYVVGFLTEKAPCLIFSTEKKESGLLGGKCVVMGNEEDIYTWKEYKPNTFKPELTSIIKERSAEGKQIPEEMKASYEVSD